MKYLTLVLLSCATLFVAPGCSKDDDDGGSTPSNSSTPREYTVEYRITSPTLTSVDYLSYSNETGGSNTFTQSDPPTALPFTVRFKRTLKRGDAVAIDATIDAGTTTSELTGTILLDGTEVKKETGRGANALVNVVYVLP